MQVKINNTIIDPSHYSFDENSNIIFNDEYKEIYNAQIKESHSLTIVSQMTLDEYQKERTKIPIWMTENSITSDSNFNYETNGISRISIN